MSDRRLKTPIVFLIFNREDTTARVFRKIRAAQPHTLLIVADGPRNDVFSDQVQCAATREVVSKVDWECKVLTNFASHNMGCKARVSSGLDWAFEHVEEAVILEDDCDPHPDFFHYCDELLARFREDKRVMMIGGNNFQFGRKRSDDSYYFSKYFHIWGWATWRRAWLQFDETMPEWPERHNNGWLESCPWLNSRAVKYWQEIFQKTYENQIDSWAYRWLYSGWKQGGLAITPQHNLVSNIGFGTDATHTKQQGNQLANIPALPLTFPLRHPPILKQNIIADQYTQNKLYSLSQLEIIRRSVKYRLARLFGNVG